MGIIGKHTYTFTCPKCKAQEQRPVLEYRASYGGSWGSPPGFSFFSVQWHDNQLGEPSPTSAVCVKCRVPADVQSS